MDGQPREMKRKRHRRYRLGALGQGGLFATRNVTDRVNRERRVWLDAKSEVKRARPERNAYMRKKGSYMRLYARRKCKDGRVRAHTASSSTRILYERECAQPLRLLHRFPLRLVVIHHSIVPATGHNAAKTWSKQPPRRSTRFNRRRHPLLPSASCLFESPAPDRSVDDAAN